MTISGENASKEGLVVYNYDLTDVQIEEILGDYFLGKEEQIQPFSLLVVSPEDSDSISNVARTIECRVFRERFSTNTPELMKDVYRPYEDSSSFVIIIDNVSNLPVGVMRLIENKPGSGMISLDDVFLNPNINDGRGWGQEEVLIDDQKIRSADDLVRIGINSLDIATIGIIKGYRRGDSESRERISDYIILGLFYGLNVYSLDHDIGLWFAILDDNVLKYLESFGLYFDRYNGVQPKPYLGSPSSTPVFGEPYNLRQGFRAQHTKDGLYELVVEGKGMDNIFNTIS
ncbi:hypothetical protein KA531_01815 [Candidatus Saccharibacteria bacterium]|nr:hypothetical protein [Candidatus Saccharibacteria bacterium]